MVYLYPVLGMVAGIFSGLVGIGGGIILVPSLVYLFNQSQHSAQGTTLALLCLPIGILGALQYFRAGHVDFRIVGLLALGFLLGSLLGAKLALGLPVGILKKIFALTLLAVSIKMLLER